MATHTSNSGKTVPCDAQYRSCPRSGHAPDVLSIAKAEGDKKKIKKIEEVLETLTVNHTEEVAAKLIDEFYSFNENDELVSDIVVCRESNFSSLIKRDRDSQPVLVLSDVDGTLVRGSLVLDHACYLHDQDIIDLGDLPSRWRDEPKNERAIEELAASYQEALTGKHKSEFLIEEFMDDVFKRENYFYSSVNEVSWLREGGARVVLISGSPQYLVEKLATRYGFEAVGSSYVFESSEVFTGDIKGMFYAGAKQKVVEGILDQEDDPLIFAYGDTLSDKPLFNVAQNKIIVEPHHETIKGLGVEYSSKYRTI